MKTQSLLPGKAIAALLTTFSLQAGTMFSQQVYDTFEGNKLVSYQTTKTARTDSMADNPAPDAVNGSDKCFKYVRSRIRYDYIKMIPYGKLVDVGNYASYAPEALKFKMKVYTTAPAGTLVEIQLGKRTGNAYPEGTNSQYQARTTVSNAWEELEFNYVVTPKGSQTNNKEVEIITLLFNPNSSTNDTYYFDDLTGPSVIVNQSSARASRRR